MKRFVSAAIVAVITAGGLSALAEAPADLATVAPVGDLTAEVTAKMDEVKEHLASQESYTETQKTDLAQDAGVLAVLAQAITEHPESSSLKATAPHLRDAAIKIANSKSYDEAKTAYETAQQAVAGKATSDAAKDYEWNKLIRMGRMMEEINSRNSRLRRVVRRPTDPDTDARHASTLAVLGLAMDADTHEVKDPAMLPQWHEGSKNFREAMTALAAALREKNTDEAGVQFKAAATSCAECHRVFRVDE